MPPASTPSPAASDVLPTLATFLGQRREHITSLWMEAVRRNPHITSADPLDSRALADRLPALFDDLADLLRGDPVGDQVTRDAASHGNHRWQQDYSLAELVQELNIVLSMVLEHGLDAFEDAHPDTPRAELRRARQCILQFFENTATGSIRQYVDKQHEERDQLHEQLRAADQALAAAVQTERDRLADLFRRSPSFMAVLGGFRHTFELTNVVYNQLVGNRPLLGRPIGEALPEIPAQGFIELLDRVYATGEPYVAKDMRVMLRNQPDAPPGEYYVDFVYQPIHAPDGRIDGVFLHGVDRTERNLAQKELARVAEQRRLALDSARLGWWQLDVAENRVHWDERLQTIFDLGKKLVTFEEVIARVHPEDRQRLTDVVQASIRPHNPAPCEIEYRVVHADGSIHWVAARGQASFDGEGAERRAVSLVGTLTDITAQRQAREELAFSAQRERTILESISDGFYAFDDQWRFTYINEAAKRVLAAHLDEPAKLLGQNYWEVFPQTRGTIIEREFRRAAEEGVTVEYEAFYEPWGCWYAMRGFPIRGGGLTAYFRDITEEKRTAQTLQVSEEKYRFLFDSIDTGFCVIEMLWNERGEPVDYRFQELNPAFEGQSGLHDATGKTIREMRPEFEQIWVDRYGHVARTGQASRFIEGSDALDRWFDVYAFALGSEQDRRVAVLFSDISERRRTEIALHGAKAEAEAASRAKDDFLAALSHELRTPLTPVLMAASDLVDDPGLPANMRETLRMMQRNIGLEARLIDDLLDLTRIAKGKLELRAQDCEAHSLVGLALEIVRDEAQAKGIALDVALGAMRTHFVGDPARVQQVFWNLLKNAVKFTPPGGHIAIRSRDEGERLVIEVTDTGVGLAPDSLESIFQPFEQAGFVNNARFGGLGLGLAIAKAIVELHGGTIRAESAGAGRGATFRVELAAVVRPMGVAEEVAPGEASTPTVPPNSAPAAGARRLLLVEDHEATLHVLTRLLTRAGYTVATASTVTEAKRIAGQETFDTVISDIGLPDGTGIELMEFLHGRYELRGIALTGYGMEDDLRRSREVGFVEHLVKPVDFAQLRRALERLGSVGAAV